MVEQRIKPIIYFLDLPTKKVALIYRLITLRIPFSMINMVEKSAVIKGKPIKLKELVEYQEGSVVSRTVIDEKTGTVTLFAFDEGEGLSEHTAPYDAMVMNLEGEVDVNIAGGTNHLVEGDMIIMPANKSHALKALTKFKMMLMMIRVQ
jgi:quercetin dioxygenase-like cupin family protein